MKQTTIFQELANDEIQAVCGGINGRDPTKPRNFEYVEYVSLPPPPPTK